MTFLALKMLVGDRTKCAGILFGVAFTCFLVTFAASYFGGMMTRSFALVAETPADIWVMDPAVVAVDQATNLPQSALNRVRSVAGVRTAVPLILATADARFPNGRFQSLQVIGVDDASLTGLPPMRDGASAAVLREPDAAVVDSGGTTGKLDTPASRRDQWSWAGARPNGPVRPLARGDELLIDVARVVVAGRADALPRFPPRPLLYTTFSNAQRVLLPERRRITFVLAATNAGADPRVVASRIEAETHLRARSAEDFKADTVRWMVANSEDVGDAVTMLTIAMLVGFGATGVMMFLFTSENLRYYAVLSAMGATGRQILGAVLVQVGLAALVGAGIGLGFCAVAGHVFTTYGFPYRMMWFAPALGGAAVILVGMAAAAIGAWPLLRMQPAGFLAGR